MSKITKAAVFRGVNEPLVVEEVTLASPLGTEVLLEVVASGLCHTDLHLIDGTWGADCPAVLGHEAAGKVLEVGDQVQGLAPGDHVIACLSAFCGTCDQCLSGFPSICENGDSNLRSADQPARISEGSENLTQMFGLGAFSNHMLVSERALVKISPEMPLDKAALIGCGVVTGTGAVFLTAGVRPGETMAVVGCGSIGLSAIQGGRIAGAGQIIALDLDDDRLAMAERMGATTTINASNGDSLAAVMDATDGKGVHYAFEAVGVPALATQAFAMLRKRGTLVLIGVMPDGAVLEFPAGSFLGERTVIGTDMGSNRFPIDMPRLVNLYLDGRLKLDELLTRRVSLEEINEGFDDMKALKGIRTIVEFD